MHLRVYHSRVFIYVGRWTNRRIDTLRKTHVGMCMCAHECALRKDSSANSE